MDQRMEIAKTLYKLGVDIEMIEQMTHISSTRLLHELIKNNQK